MAPYFFFWKFENAALPGNDATLILEDTSKHLDYNGGDITVACVLSKNMQPTVAISAHSLTATKMCMDYGCQPNSNGDDYVYIWFYADGSWDTDDAQVTIYNNDPDDPGVLFYEVYNNQIYEYPVQVDGNTETTVTANRFARGDVAGWVCVGMIKVGDCRAHH